MSIRKSGLNFEEQYTIVPNAWVRDENLSWKARGLLAYLVSHVDGWQTSERDLTRHAPDGRASVRSAIAELEAAGYLTREQARDQDHRYAEVDYIITDPAVESRGSISGPPETRGPEIEPHKKNSPVEDQQTENHALTRKGRATQKQIDLLVELWKESGMWPTDAIQARWREWSISEIDDEIRFVKREKRKKL